MITDNADDLEDLWESMFSKILFECSVFLSVEPVCKFKQHLLTKSWIHPFWWVLKISVYEMREKIEYYK